MPDMEYTTGDLRTGAKHAQTASDSADDAATTLSGSGAGASPFGNVNGADALHGAVGTARNHHALSARTSSENLSTAATRSSGTADLGDDNTAETSRLAPRSAQAGAVTDAM